jgi:DNA-binding CsgD family transcriptional regulator
VLLISETALALCNYNSLHTREDSYLKLFCAEACLFLGRDKEAKQYLLGAMDADLPYGFITPFAEGISYFGGHMESLLEQEYPQYYGAITEQWGNIYANRLIVHNRFAKDQVTLALTLREYQVAVFVTRDVPRARIAQQFNVSQGRINNIIETIYSKLSISSKKELSEHVPFS